MFVYVSDSAVWHEPTKFGIITHFVTGITDSIQADIQGRKTRTRDSCCQMAPQGGFVFLPLILIS